MSLPVWKAQVKPPSLIFLEIIQLRMKHARREDMSAPPPSHPPYAVFALY
jgi:hypothetical protein